MKAKSINHIGISVPSIQQAIEFYHGVLGMEVIDQHEFAASPTVDQITAVKGASAKSALFDAGNIFLEVFEFTSPQDKGQTHRPVSDLGYTHLAFEVSLEEVEDMYALLARKGVQWHCDLIDNPGTEPMKMCYGRDPFGNVIEIQGMPDSSHFSNRNRIKES
ncbi:VOC family protein [Paraferrimonas sp. SM1919]|uniref:VOC family protein n=1 Tax=Paraferrimonas sp. SM1919 TaxID=2662263 RepID=UPI0013D2A69F|nr:VOC family protein [Paraferrimonas sp. SM1919]